MLAKRCVEGANLHRFSSKLGELGLSLPLRRRSLIVLLRVLYASFDYRKPFTD
jgi:hypothetical protein